MSFYLLLVVANLLFKVWVLKCCPFCLSFFNLCWRHYSLVLSANPRLANPPVHSSSDTELVYKVSVWSAVSQTLSVAIKKHLDKLKKLTCLLALLQALLFCFFLPRGVAVLWLRSPRSPQRTGRITHLISLSWLAVSFVFFTHDWTLDWKLKFAIFLFSSFVSCVPVPFFTFLFVQHTPVVRTSTCNI